MGVLHMIFVLLVGVAIIFACIVDIFVPTPYNAINRDSEPRNHLFSETVTVGPDFENIFWFVQITDIHISKFRDRKRGPDLIHFCREYLSILKPQLVIVTGDLVDARSKDTTGSKQYIEEWQEYKNALTECSKYSNSRWLDLRGNHDAFNVPELRNPQNFYRKYSMQGGEHMTSYLHQYTTYFGKYSFIAVDACPDPGPKRPFNFFGQLNEDRVQQLIRYAEQSEQSNMTIWFGHYPTSFIVQDPPGIRHVMRNGIVYLCGHLHTLGGFVTDMYTRQKTGTLELELGDWRDNRMFRVLVVDHDLLSFVDVHLGDWPVILITNPKNAQFHSPFESIERIQLSTHVRVLVFSHLKILSVSVHIDDDILGEAKHVNGPLYVIKWNPAIYTVGLHTIEVTVKDSESNTKTVLQPFSLDGSAPEFSLIPRMILMMNIFTVGKFIFAVMVFAYILLLGFLRQSTNIRNFFLDGGGTVYYLFNRWLWKLWLTSRINLTYYSLLGSVLYITFGPWFAGEMLEGHTGVVFVWGIFVKGTFLPGSHTFFYGIFQMITFNIPLLLFVSNTVDLLYIASGNLKEIKARQIGRWQKFLQLDVPFLTMLVFQAYITLTEFPRAYGTKALVLGPVRTGSLILAVILHYCLFRLPLKSPSICPANRFTYSS
ncbi:transmembrane protein 62-like [Gigantopelta aegis]|uniref:transmembrane protein 62-like n=1 Tax=Gigantopelta aegis TaxID=1735272 RepID=UPI001B88AD30|nr:transmembrane protein 62-like [Gigantopelta aegis]